MYSKSLQRSSILLAFLAFLLLSPSIEAKSRSGFDVERIILGDDSRGPFLLGVTGLIPGTDSVRIGEVRLVRGLEYDLSLEEVTLVLSEPLPRGQKLTFTAQRTLRVLGEVRRRERPSDGQSRILTTLRADAHRMARAQPERSEPDEGLAVSGVKRLQVAVGTSSEAAFSQSLRLEISGMLADGVRVTGFLTDRNLPVQAAGRSRSVQDLDRVHLEVASSSFSAGLGDVDVAFEGTTFGRYHRQLEGARFRMRGRRGDVDLFGAVAEGEWETGRITTRPGYQGPYTLSTRSRQISAGSERLFLNGLQLRRGEGQDYVIDYDRGLITFTPGRPITGESRITAEFQTVDPGGRIRSIGMRGQMLTGDHRVRLGTTLIRESRGTAGAAVPRAGQGDIPGAFLSSIDGAFSPSDGLRMEGEIAWSRRATEAQSQAGHAARLGMTWVTPQARERVSGVGALQLTGSFRQISDSFRSFDRVDPIAREGVWGWESDATSAAGNVGELGLRYTPTSFAALGLQLGHRTGSLAGQRLGTTLDLEGRKYGHARFSIDQVRRSGGRLSRLNSVATAAFGWFRPTIRFESESAEGAAVRGSRLFYAAPITDLPKGARIREADLTSEIGSRQLSLTSSIRMSQIDQLTTVWSDSVRELTHTNRFSATTTSGFQLSGSFGQTARRDRLQGDGTQVVNLGRIRLGYRPADGMLSQQVQYQVSSTGLADRDRLFVEVPDGDGSYVWEDVDGDGEQDDEEFIPEPGGNYAPLYGVSLTFEPVRESSVGLRTMVDFGRGRFGQVSMLKELAFEVALESERRGRPADGGSIAPWTHSSFPDDPGVLTARREVRSTLHVFRRQKMGSLRVDARFADDLDRRLSEGGRTEVRGWTFVGKLRPRKGWDVEGRTEVVSRARRGEGAFAHDISERGAELRNWMRLPEGWQIGLGLAWGDDSETQRGLETRKITIGPELRRAFRGRGRLTSRFDWTRVSANEPLPLFLGLADGHRRGQNYRWRVGLDYRLGTYVDAFITYDGTLRPERPALHVGRMELRATF